MKRTINSLITATFVSSSLLLGASVVKAEPLVYVPLGSENKISIIDPKQDQIIGSIEGLQAIHGLAATLDGRFLIAGSYAERSANDTPDKPKSVTEDEHAAHHTTKKKQPSQETDASVSTVSVIRTKDGKIIRAINVPGSVHHVAVSPDGQYATVTHPTEDEVSVIDLMNYKVVANIQTGGSPNYSVFSPDSARLYVSNAGDDTISVVSAKNWNVETNISVGSGPEHLVLSKNGKTLFINNVDDGSISIVDTPSNSQIKKIRVGSKLHGIDLSEDENALYVAARGKNSVYQIDINSETFRTIALFPAPYHLSRIEGAGKIYVSSSDQSKIWVISQKSLSIIGEISIDGTGHQMVTIPDA